MPTTAGHNRNRGGDRKHLGGNGVAEPAKSSNDDIDNENQCPNIFVPAKRTAASCSGNNVAKIAKLFEANAQRQVEGRKINFRGHSQKTNGHNHIVRHAAERNQIDHHDDSNVEKKTNEIICNMDTEDVAKRETRRKIMLQQRRMEKVLSLKSVEVSTSPRAKRDLRQDFAEESTKESWTEEVTKYKKRKISSDERDVLPLDNVKGPSSINYFKFLSQMLLISLSFYHVQLHYNDSVRFDSSSVHYIKNYFKKMFAWINSSFMLSGNAMLLRLLLEWRHGATWAIFFEWGPSISLEGVLHVVFVGVVSVRSLVVSFTWTRRFVAQESTGKENRSARILKCGLLFLASAVAWMMILPLLSECDLGSEKYCFFVQSVSKGRKNVVERFISSPRYSCLDVMARKFCASLSLFLKTKIKGHLFKELRRAFINPFKFHGRIKKLFTMIRWAKFLAPLIGTCNKLRGHILDMIKKRGQHVTSKAARKMWTDVIQALSLQSKTERAVLQLQKRFRERREQKAKRRIELMSSERPSAHHIRKRLREERDLSKSKLIKMEILDNQRELRRQVSKCEKENIVKHRYSIKLENRRLLLSPKTAFAVGWKYAAIGCVLLEVSQMIFAPLLSGELKKMSLDDFISVALFASCNKSREFCARSAWKKTWLMMVQVISRILVPLVYAVCFLDVFVTFSTGELTSNGKLVPKPVFDRYIFPGIGLQLIVNPTMVAFSKLVKRAIVYSLHVGPSLCFHFILVCLPVVIYCYDLLLGIIFEFIEKQNKVLSNRSIFD